MSARNQSRTPVYLAGTVLAGGLVGTGFFAPAGSWVVHHYLVTSGLLALTAIKLFKLSTRSASSGAPGGAGDRRDAIEAGLLLLLCVQIPIQATGGLLSPAVPAMYLLVALLAAYTDPASAALFVGVAISLTVPQLGNVHGWTAIGQWSGSLARYGLTIAGFAFVLGSFMRMERTRRLQMTAALDRFNLDADALANELEAPSAEDLKPAIQAERDRRVRQATRALDESLYNVLKTSRTALGAYSVLYLRYDGSRDRLTVRQLVTDDDHVIEDGLPAKEAGLLSGVLKTATPVSLSLRKRPLPYYLRQPRLDRAIAVPVLEVATEAHVDPAIRGVLVADFVGDVADGAVELLASFGRTLAELERDAREREVHALRAHRLAHYFDTSKQLTSTLALEEVLTVAIKACQQLARFDFATFVETAPEGRRFNIRKAVGESSGKLTEKDAAVDGSLVGWVIKNRQYLPIPNFKKRALRTPLFAKRLDPDGIRSALIFPLAREGQTVGAFVVGSLTRDAFDDDEIQLLEGVANQTALAMANAILYSRMQEMATTDGLTGLANHRYFQESFSRELDRAQRGQKPVALILMDVDHFKNVNDSYGHPVGDEVLRRLAGLLKDVLQRTIDLPARYGGEEFVTVLPETDAKGARRVADKIRTALAKEKFDGGDRTFQVTLSAGVAIYPADGAHKQALIDHADKALYHSKESGRNRTTLWSEVPDEDAPAPVKPLVAARKEHR